MFLVAPRGLGSSRVITRTREGRLRLSALRRWLSSPRQSRWRGTYPASTSRSTQGLVSCRVGMCGEVERGLASCLSRVQRFRGFQIMHSTMHANAQRESEQHSTRHLWQCWLHRTHGHNNFAQHTTRQGTATYRICIRSNSL